jgi:hypothetical protein
MTSSGRAGQLEHQLYIDALAQSPELQSRASGACGFFGGNTNRIRSVERQSGRGGFGRDLFDAGR